MPRVQHCLPAGGKHIHYTQGDALAKATASARGSGLGMSVYQCPHGNHWHLTSSHGERYRWLNMKFDLRVTDLLLAAAPVDDIDDAVGWLAGRWPTPAHLLADHLADGRARLVVHWDERRRALEWQRSGGWTDMAPKQAGR